jgi:hypothetical protein
VPWLEWAYLNTRPSAYEGRVKDGGILLSVHSDNSDETKRAKEILQQTGAQDISSTGEARGDKTVVPVREIA